MLSISYSYFSSGRKNNKFRVYFPFYFIHHRAGRERGRDFALKFLGQNILRRREQEIGERERTGIRGREERRKTKRRGREKSNRGERERNGERGNRERGRMSRNRRQGKTRVI